VRTGADPEAPAAPSSAAPLAKRRRRCQRESVPDAELEPEPLLQLLWKQVPKLRSQFAASAEAPHCFLQAPCLEPGVLAGIRDEVVTEMKGLEPVESEEAKVLLHPLPQRMAGSEEGAALPRLTRLADVLQGTEFRRLLEEATGSAIVGQPEVVVLAVPPGGYWLPQRHALGGLSWILFLTEDWWEASDGGALEIYESVSTVPSSMAAALFNSMVVMAGTTTAGLAEVVTQRGPVLALHGAYSASPSLLRMDRPLSPVPLPASVPGSAAGHAALAVFGDADRAALRGLVRARYLRKRRMSALQDRFATKSHIVLRRFLSAKVAAKVTAECSARDEADGVIPGALLDHGVGASGDWKLIGPACHRRHLALGSAGANDSALGLVVAGLLGEPFAQYLEALTGLTRQQGEQGEEHGSIKAEARRFRPGRDFIRRHSTGTPRLESVLCLLGSSTAADGRNCGGALCYAEEAEEEEEDSPEEQAKGPVGQRCSGREDAAESASGRGPSGRCLGPLARGADDLLPPLLRAEASGNVLHIVLRDAHTASFLEPICADAPASRWDVLSSFAVCPLSDSSGEEDEEEDSA